MKNAVRKKLQHVGLGVAATAAVLTATGCGYVSPQATADEYAPSDGIQTDIGDIKVRNLLVVAEDANSEGRVLGTLVNTSDTPETVTLTTADASTQIKVPANDSLQLEKAQPVTLAKAGAQPGRMTNATIKADGQSAEVGLPVLDHTFPRYASFVPGGAPSTPANPSNTPHEKSEEGGH